MTAEELKQLCLKPEYVNKYYVIIKLDEKIWTFLNSEDEVPEHLSVALVLKADLKSWRESGLWQISFPNLVL